MEIQILGLKKFPEKIVINGNDVLVWIKFFSGRSKKEFEEMAKTNEYLDEAYNALVDLSADEVKRREYEAREKALKDYNTQMESAFKRGVQQGEKRGEIRGIQKTRKVFQLHAQGENLEEIARICDLEEGEIDNILFGD